jgi:hypothetical protein
MKADPRFLRLPKDFWAHVRSLSQKLGYTNKVGQVKVPSLAEVLKGLEKLGLSSGHIIQSEVPTTFGKDLLAYFDYRARMLNEFVLPRLMDKDRAKKELEALRLKLNPVRPVPMNKQKGEKRAPAYMTGIVNMIVEAGMGKCDCDFDPRRLTTITRNGMPLRTLARRVDGAFPSSVNPIVIWEIKEYYYTTTFGSRVADGVYETLLDGMELEELSEHEKVDVKHYLFVDDVFTWWIKGKSYLCRVVDMLHMGYVDEVLFGYEVIERLPGLVSEWVAMLPNSPLQG